MNEAATRPVHLIEVIIIAIAAAWAMVTWQDIHAQISSTAGWARILLGGAMWVLALGALAWGGRRWVALRIRALLPALLVGLGFVANMFVTRLASADVDDRFQAGKADYESIVASVVSGRRPAGTIPRDSLPAALADCCLSVEVTTDPALGGRGVFITQWTFGPKQAGWLYIERGRVAPSLDLLGARFGARQVSEHWYRIREGKGIPE